MIEPTFNDNYQMSPFGQAERQRARLAVAARSQSVEDCALILKMLDLIGENDDS